jgi:hypothetical protein
MQQPASALSGGSVRGRAAVIERSERCFEDRNLREVLRPTGCSFAFENACKRKNVHSDTLDVDDARGCPLLRKRAQAIGMRDDIKPIAEGATNCRRLHSERAGHVDPSSGANGVCDTWISECLEPQVEILRDAGCSLEDRRAHADEHETNAASIELAEQGDLWLIERRQRHG